MEIKKNSTPETGDGIKFPVKLFLIELLYLCNS